MQKIIKILLVLQIVFVLLVGFKLAVYPIIEKDWLCHVNPNIGTSYCYNAKVATTFEEKIVQFHNNNILKIIIAQFIISLLGFLFSAISRKKGYPHSRLLFWISFIYIAIYLLAYIFADKGHPKGHDAVIKSNLSNIRAQAELVFDKNSDSYKTLCEDTLVVKMLNDAKKVGKSTTAKCFSDTDSYVITAVLTDKNASWCVDSSGTSKTITNFDDSTIVDANTKCPLTGEEILKKENDNIVRKPLQDVHSKYNISYGIIRDNFSQVCTDPIVITSLKEVEKSVNEKPKCLNNMQDYIITVKLKNTENGKDYYCLDSKFDTLITKEQNEKLVSVKDFYYQCTNIQ